MRTGILMAVPFSDQMIEGMDSLYEKAEKATGMEGGYNFSESIQASAAQYPNAFRISEAVASLVVYATEASLIQSIPVVGKLTGAAGSRAAALAERLGANPALQKGIAAGVARITADQTVDTMIHTAPGIVSDAREGKKVTEIGLNALKAEGEDLGLNIGSELVIDAAGIAVKKVVGAVRGGKATKVISNLGNEIDITPSSNHSTVLKNPGPKGNPNSSVDILDDAGNVATRRWYNSKGNAYRDVDMTNHGNPKTHPEHPHEHTWDWSSGNPKRSK